MNIKPADLILVRGTGIIDKAIEDVTYSQYSHVAGLVKPNEVVEAQSFRETGYAGLDFYGGRSDVFTCDVLTDEQRQHIVDFVISKVGTHYAYRLIGWELGHYILHIDLPYHPDNEFDCMTLWAEAYRSEGVDPFPGIKYPVPGDVPNSSLFRKSGSF